MADDVKTTIDASSHIHAIFPNAEVAVTGVPVKIAEKITAIPINVHRLSVTIVRFS